MGDSSSRYSVNEIFALLACYTVYIVSCLQIFRGNLLIPFSSLEMGPIGPPETSLTTNIRGVRPRRTKITFAGMFVSREMWCCLCNFDGRNFSSLSLYRNRGNWSGLAFRNFVVVAVMNSWVWEQHERLYKFWWALGNNAKRRQGSITAERLSESARRSTEQTLARRIGPEGRPGLCKSTALKFVTNIPLPLGLMKFWNWIPALNPFRVLVPIPRLRMTTCASYLLHLSLTAPSYMLHLSDVIQHWPSFCRHRHTIFLFVSFADNIVWYIHT